MTTDEIAERINYFSKLYSILLETCKSLKVSIDSSPLYNFRDALFHYQLFHDAANPQIRLAQETSIIEHLNRGLKDGCYFILLNLKVGVYKVMEQKQQHSPEQARKFRAILHRYKSLELDLRKPEMINTGTIIDCINKLVPLLQETRKLFNEHKEKWDFSKVFIK